MSSITKVFINVDMRNGHNGLAEIAKEHKINVTKLEPGEHIIFVNSSRTKMKVYSANEVLSYVRRDEKISLDAVRYIPLAWQSKQKFDYDAALRMAVDKSLSRGQRKTLEVF